MNFELDMPAGNLQCALHAFKGGADAVYVGARSFSARAGADNFSFEDLRKLKALCIKENRKFYIALNTLLTDDDFESLETILRELEFIGPDALIVQDLGVAAFVKKNFPSLELHCSTQLAVHNESGVREMIDLGFKRVVLSRELSFEEIKSIKEKCPDVEYKIFIHGAMCYGFSGLCMASQHITGRSGNCGQCAQICRTWFTCRETGEKLFPFSMKDLCIGEKIRKYQEIGISSFKVEGRMKSPEYVYWTSRYYRMLLDGKTEDDSQVMWAKQAMQIAFSRSTTEGFFETKTNGSMGSDAMVSSDYPSHRGIEVGRIKKVLSNQAMVEFSQPVSLRDGLLVISDCESAGFALRQTGSSRSFIAEGETATINFPTEKFTRKPQSGTAVYCTSRHDGTLAQINENIPLYKKALDLNIILRDTDITINQSVFPLTLSQADKPRDLQKQFEDIFSASDKSYFTSGRIILKNESSFENIFIPLSALKQIRRDFYEKCDRTFLESLSKTSVGKKTFDDSYHLSVIPEGALILDPLMFDEKKAFSGLEEKKPSVVGVNNVCQLQWLRKHPEMKFFAASFLYVKNAWALELLRKTYPNFIGYYSDEQNLPLFISRVCMRHHSLGLPCKGCSRDNSYTLIQNSRQYRVRCRDCITTMTEL